MSMAGPSERPLADITSRSTRGLLVGGAVSLWVVGLMWALNQKGVLAISPRSDVEHAVAPSEASEPERVTERDEPEAVEPVTEITVEAARRRAEAPPVATEVLALPIEPEPIVDVPTYRVWFESERSLGVCKVVYAGGSKTANLHVSTRLPAGPLEFTWRCGKHSGRGSIEVEPKRINGVLFCSDSGDVRVETTRRKDGRCAS